MTAIVDCRNLGPKSAALLAEVGVCNLAQLRELGAINVMLRLQRLGHKPNLNLLYALEGAITDCHWQQVARSRKGELLLALDAALAFDRL
ncbi:TfoX/Sxy family protein [Shewanella cyperi]|uniref:TfoX/Sxy family protein n=1 Tax=Shewanella cyperi TaxID=2814292 RepID=UPI001A94DEA1|nr:TfoX/Sxy family protein [Shewanella cyperi]QSX39736.1 TfoX/Sxy family protein [Shewanella cyperi]